jgi:thioredoxin-like negative regulator of GroEL
VIAGTIEETAGAREAAGRLYAEAETRPTRSSEAIWRLAALRLEAGRVEEAGAILARLPPGGADDRLAVLRLARAEIAADLREAAIARLEAARLRDPSDAEIASLLGRTALDLGRTETARVSLEDALRHEQDAKERREIEALLARARRAEP